MTQDNPRLVALHAHAYKWSTCVAIIFSLAISWHAKHVHIDYSALLQVMEILLYSIPEFPADFMETGCHTIFVDRHSTEQLFPNKIEWSRYYGKVATLRQLRSANRWPWQQMPTIVRWLILIWVKNTRSTCLPRASWSGIWVAAILLKRSSCHASKTGLNYGQDQNAVKFVYSQLLLYKLTILDINFGYVHVFKVIWATPHI